MSKLTDLIAKYPELDYFSGNFYATPESEDILECDANTIIADHYYETLGCSRSGMDVVVALEDEFNIDFGDDKSWEIAFKNV